MLQSIRKKSHGVGAKIIVGVIVFSFAAFGIQSILIGSGGNEVAKVNGEPIAASELQQQINLQKRQLLNAMGDNVDPSMLDDQLMQAPALQRLIQTSLMTQAAAAQNLAISDEQLGRIVGTTAAFLQDGQFSPSLYRNLLAQSGFSPGMYQESLRKDLLIGQLRAGMSGSEFATPMEVKQLARVQEQQRDIRYLTLPLEQFRADQQISAEAVQQYYDDNASSFRTREAVELDYIELTPEQFVASVDEEQLREEFALRGDDFQRARQVRVAHIMLQGGADETKAALQQRLAELVERLHSGEAFAALAAELSVDIGSAKVGGDLGYSSGEAFPEEIETALELLTMGEVSAPVETEAGWHVLKITEEKLGSSASFDDVRAQLAAELEASAANLALLKAVEELKDLVFNAESLADPAEDMALTVLHSGPVTRSHNEGVLATASLLAAAYSDEVLQQGHNSDVIELAANHFVVLRVRRHIESVVKPLSEVHDDIVSRVAESGAREAVVAVAAQMLRQLREGASIEQLALDGGYDWQVELGAKRNLRTLPQELLQRAFELPVPGPDNSSFDYVVDRDGSIEVFELDRVSEADLSRLNELSQASMQRQLRSEQGRAIDQQFSSALRSRADIDLL